MRQPNNDEPSLLTKLKRRLGVFLLAARVFVSYKLVQKQESKLKRQLGLDTDDDNHPQLQQLWDKAHERNSLRILSAIEKLQGFWIKVGQYLSSRADVMPIQYLSNLAKLQDGVPAKPFEDIQQTLSEQLSPQQLSRIESIDEIPLSTASLAQVHRAKLTNQLDVVLKVQHRGVASLMLQDMDNLRTILRLLALLEPDLDYNPVVDEYTKEVQKELDFRTEARNMQEIKQMLEERKVCVIVPDAVSDLVTEKVLVMEYCEGFPIRDIEKLDQFHVDRRLLLDRVVTSWAAQMHLLATFNADPHAGNILVSTKNEMDASVPILLDFGLTKRLDPEMKVAFSRLVHSSYETDVDGLLQSFDEMGLKLNRYDPFQDMAAMQASLSDTTPQSQAKAEQERKAKEHRERQEAMRQEQGVTKGQKLRNPVDAWPSELIFFTRVSAMLRGLCSRLEVRYPYLERMAEAAGETLRESVPKHEHALGTVYEPKAGEPVVRTPMQDRLCRVVAELIDEEHAIGLQVTVIHQDEVVANIAAGTLGTVNPRPVLPTSLFNVFSVSKAVLATGVLKLLQERDIPLDDSIAKHWPAFGDSHPDKQLITIRHALTHQAGLANAFPANASIETLTDWNHMKQFISGPEAFPSHVPGEETNYHYLTFAWILGGFIEEVTGDSYENYLMKHLIAPLGLENEIHMGGLPDEIAREELAVVTARTLRDRTEVSSKDRPPGGRMQPPADSERNNTEARSRLAKFRGKEQLLNPTVFNMQSVRGAKIPSANGHMSSQALAKLMHAVTTSGQILSVKMMELAGTPQKCKTDSAGSSTMLDNARAAFGLGFQIHDLARRDGVSFRSVGHAGFGGSIVLSIPEANLTMALTTNQLTIKSVARDKVLETVLDELGIEAPRSLVDA